MPLKLQASLQRMTMDSRADRRRLFVAELESAQRRLSRGPHSLYMVQDAQLEHARLSIPQRRWRQQLKRSASIYDLW